MGILPKNRDYKQSSYWQPKPPRKSVDKLDRPKETLQETLRNEDKAFDRQWRKYWAQRGKWNSFEDFLKAAA